MAIQSERQIVGVVGNVRTAGTDPTPLPVIYMPHRQAPVAIMNLVLASVGDPSLLAREAEATAWNMSGDVNVYGTEVLSDRIDRFEWSSDVSALLLGLSRCLRSSWEQPGSTRSFPIPSLSALGRSGCAWHSGPTAGAF